MATVTNRVDLSTRVTSHIVEELERGTRPWLKPWNAEHAAGRINRPLRHNGQKYSGINVITLWMSAELSGFVSPFWLTFKQCQELGAFVKKGEHGSPVVYASKFTKKDKASRRRDRAADSVPERVHGFQRRPGRGIAQLFLRTGQGGADQAAGPHRAGGAILRQHQGRDPHRWQPSLLRLRARLHPDPAAGMLSRFRIARGNAGPRAHALDADPSRLNREFGRKKFGDEGYAMEELVADSHRLSSVRPGDHARGTRGPRELYRQLADRAEEQQAGGFLGSVDASRAVDYLHSLQPKPAE